MTTEARDSDGLIPALGPETTGQFPQDELMTPDDFISTVSTHVAIIDIDSGAPVRGNVLRLSNEETQGELDWQDPRTWNPSKRIVERYRVYLNPNYDQETVAVAFLHQLVAIKTDVDRYRNRPPVREISDEEKAAEAARIDRQAQAFYRAYGDLVDSRLVLVWPRLLTT